MRLPNLSVSDSITNTIRSLDLQRYKLDQQISSGQKITLPEDDGMRLGRVINLDTEKSKLAQYQRNASYASEFLNAGHLNLDNLRELNQRAQEISRVAGSSLNGPAMETYGNEINQLIGADGLIYQDLDDLVDAVRELNPDLKSFEDSVFSACYITKEVDDAYLEALAKKRSDGAKQEAKADSEDACLDLRADAS